MLRGRVHIVWKLEVVAEKGRNVMLSLNFEEKASQIFEFGVVFVVEIRNDRHGIPELGKVALRGVVYEHDVAEILSFEDSQVLYDLASSSEAAAVSGEKLADVLAWIDMLQYGSRILAIRSCENYDLIVVCHSLQKLRCSRPYIEPQVTRTLVALIRLIRILERHSDGLGSRLHIKVDTVDESLIEIKHQEMPMDRRRQFDRFLVVVGNESINLHVLEIGEVLTEVRREVMVVRLFAVHRRMMQLLQIVARFYWKGVVLRLDLLCTRCLQMSTEIQRSSVSLAAALHFS